MKRHFRIRVACVLSAILIATPPAPVSSASTSYPASSAGVELAAAPDGAAQALSPIAPASVAASSGGGDPSVGAGVELPILQGATWAYFKGTVEPPAAWNTIGFDDSSWLTGPSGFGYGDGDDATVLSDMQNSYVSVYTRRQFEVPSPASVLALEMRVDYDDGFVAYINGVEVARRNVPSGIPPFNALAPASHEASAGASGNPSETINLNAFLGLLLSGTNVIAVQGLNRALSSTDLSLIVELRQVNAPPGAPSSPSPAPGATGVSLNPTLCVSVSDPDGGSLTATFHGREVTGTPGDDFTIIALPDTQYYSASYPTTYSAQTQWIVDNRVPRNIVFVTQLGDCVDNASVNQQLVNADAAWDIIEGNPYSGQPWGIPYGIAVGNHDQTPAGDPGTIADEGATTSAFNTWFGVSRYAGRGYYASHYGTNNDNHYELFSVGGMDFIALHLEFMPSDSPLRQSVLAWANGVLQAYPNRRAMLTSHYLMETGTSTAFSNQGQATYDALKGNPNLFLMLAGHLDQASRRSDTFNGHTVYTLKSDYQTRPNGGDGWLRILTFSPQNDEIRVQTYSPVLGQFINNHPDNVAGTPQNDFVLTYAMDGGQPFVTIGSDVQTSPGTACVPWPGRQAGKQYEWYVTVSDGTDTTTGSRNTFTTAATCSQSSDCADGNLCNGVETCVGSVCQPGAPPDCDDVDACTADSCLPATGCQHAAISCDDINPCTTDSCAPLSGCQHQSVSCPQGEVCNAQTGLCQAPATTCTVPVDCDDGDPCTTDACDNANLAALSFDGTNDYVTMGEALGLNASPSFTVEAWINGTTGQALDTTGTNGISGSIPLVSKGGPQDESPININMNYYLGLKAGTLVADFEDNINGGNYPICGSTSIGTGWHHVAATYNGTMWALYVDGAAETLSVACSTCAGCTASPGVAPVSNSTQHFALGTSLETGGVLAGTTPGYYGGMLDEVRVWNVARTQAEIQAARFLELTSGAGLIGRWDLNEGTGLTANDSTSPDEDGTLTNGPLWEPTDIAPIGTGTCTHAPIPGCRLCNGNEECLDTDICNGTESCSDGVCQPGTPFSCDDGNACTSDTCDVVDGCQHGIVNCNDGVACTTDSCDSLLGCQNASNCPQGQACNLSTGACEQPCSIAADCNDSNQCTNDTCSGGFCVHSDNSASCNDGVVCTTDSCDPGLGCLHTETAGACDDGNACTTDSCVSSNVSSASFDGNGDYISFGLASTHTELGAARFTLEAWVKWDGTSASPTSTGSGGINALPIVTKGRAEADATNQDMNYFLGIQGGTLAADFEEALGTCVGGSNPGASCYFSCSLTTATRCSLTSQCPGGEACTTVNGCTGGGTCDGVAGLNHPVVGATALTANTWAHVAATYDGNCWQLYLNGAPDGAPVCTGNRLPRADSIQPFAIGTAMTSTPTAAGFFPGAIDEVRVWNYARTASQIRDAMNSTIRTDSTNPATRLIGRWGLDEVSGTNAGDSAGYANNGTLTGNAAFVTTGLQTLTGCVSANVPNGTSCNDGNVCTSPDTCTGGLCGGSSVPGCCLSAADCNDGNACTNDVCTGNVCSNPSNTAQCDDGNVCTADSCAGAPSPFALEFDGTDDYVTFGNPAELGLPQFTIETWFYRTGTGISNTTGTGGITTMLPLVTKGAPEGGEGNNLDANYILGINTTGNVIAADFEDNATGLNHPVSGTTAIALSTWNHAAATYDGTTWRLYLNGNLEATSVVGAFTPRFDSLERAALGTMLFSTGTRNGAFQGVLDEARIWNYARSQTEIQNTRFRQITSVPGLVARWGLNEGSGTTAGDSKAPLSNGTLTNFTLPAAWVAGAPTLQAAECSSSAIAGCCLTSAECNDGLACTSDACVANACSFTPIPGCTSCTTDIQCDDGSTCTADSCSTANDAAVDLTAASGDYVDLGQNATANNFINNFGTSSFTIEGWFYARSVGATDLTGIFRAGQQGTNAPQVAIQLKSGATPWIATSVERSVGGTGTAQIDTNTAFSAAAAVSLNAWHHVALVMDRAAPQLRTYLDGMLVGTVTPTWGAGDTVNMPAGLATVLGAARLAAPGSGLSIFLDGYVDEFRIWSVARTGAEILADKNREIVSATNLVHRWGFNESSGPAIDDPGTFDGTFVGAALRTTTVLPTFGNDLCVHSATNNGSACDDANACTTGTTCAAGVCGGGTTLNCDDGNTCTTDSCSGGVCNHVPVSDGTACNDSNACTQTDSCQAGSCVGSNPVTCTNGDQCNDPGTCNPATGTCSAATPKANGTACNDGNACTQTDSCQAGSCVGSNPVTCNNGDQCNDPGTCNPATGTCSAATPKANGTACNDGNACTQTDVCTSGVCAGTAISCNDNNLCTDDTCNPTSGCVYTPDDSNLGPITCGVGVCERTVPGCLGGQEQTCVPGTATGTDNNCNGVDENCNGTADENYVPTPTSCGGIGFCGAGQLICTGGVLEDTCTPGVPATANVAVQFNTPTLYRANVTGPPEDTTLVALDSEMRYLANASDPGIGTTWTAEVFDEGSTPWSDGTYGVGYETATAPPWGVDLFRTTPQVPSGTYSVYTRATFEITDISAVRTVLVGADYDDGWVAWINGVEVARSSTMPAGAPDWNTNAALHESSNGTSPNYGALVDVTSTALSALHTGTNVLAVGVWNSGAPTSTDLVLVPKLAIGTDWTGATYDVSTWLTGPFGVGYETSPPGAESLIVTDVPTGTASVFTRTTFNVTNPAAVQELFLGADYDDGFVAWINGVEVYGSPEVGRSTTWDAAVASHESSNGATPDYGGLIDISALGLPALHAGTNVLAVGIWNTNPSTSTDLVLVPRLSLGEAESCDGLDNDCDGVVDEGYPDLDGDGVRDCVDPDDDGDGVPDGTDCAPWDSASSGGPLAEVTSLAWSLHPEILRWTEQGAGVRYDVVTGTLAAMRADGGVIGASCLGNDLSVGVFDDLRPAPAPGGSYYYLVRAQKSSCANGTYGYASSSVERVVPASPCP